MASGGAPPTYTCYFHAQQEQDGARILVEMKIHTSPPVAQVTVKAENSTAGAQFRDVLVGGLNQFL